MSARIHVATRAVTFRPAFAGIGALLRARRTLLVGLRPCTAFGRRIAAARLRRTARGRRCFRASLSTWGPGGWRRIFLGKRTTLKGGSSAEKQQKA